MCCHDSVQSVELTSQQNRTAYSRNMYALVPHSLPEAPPYPPGPPPEDFHLAPPIPCAPPVLSEWTSWGPCCTKVCLDAAFITRLSSSSSNKEGKVQEVRLCAGSTCCTCLLSHWPAVKPGATHRWDPSHVLYASSDQLSLFDRSLQSICIILASTFWCGMFEFRMVIHCLMTMPVACPFHK